jgi:hypothetical protein
MSIDALFRSQQGCSSHEVNPVLFRKMLHLTLGLCCSHPVAMDFCYSRIRDCGPAKKYGSGKIKFKRAYSFPIKEKGAQ